MAVSVKDFLDAIRGRYQDEPNKVEVTGSIVEKEKILDDVQVTPGSTATAIVNCENYSFFNLILDHLGSENHEITLSYRYRFQGERASSRFDIDTVDEMDWNHVITKRVELLTNEIEIELTNDSNEDRNYDLHIRKKI